MGSWLGGNKILPANKKLIWVTRAVCSVAVKPGLDLLNCYLHCRMFCLQIRFLSVKTLCAVALDSAKPSYCFGVSSDMGSVRVCESMCVCMYGYLCVMI